MMLAIALVPLCGLGFYCFYLLSCAWYFSRIKKNKKREVADLPFVSIVIAMRNEEANIENCLRDIFAQDFPKEKLEVILVDDHSEDNSIAKIKMNFANSSLKLISLENTEGKKAAIAMGIQSSNGEVIVTTDADCRMGPGWLRALIGFFDSETGMVSGPVSLETQTVFSKLQALEFMGLIAVGASGIEAGRPNMCNGANLAYRRSAFESVNGFEGSLHLPSGDDEFLMHKISADGKWKIKFAADSLAIVKTPAPNSLRSFAAQRKRWVSKSRHYQRAGLTFTLALSWIGMLSFPLLAAFGFADSFYWMLLGIAFGAKVFSEFSVLAQAAFFFNKFSLLLFLVPEQFLHIVYVIWAGIAGNFGRYEWKGRRS